MSAPRISVVMGVHNGARFLSESLASLTAQTEPSWEAVIVDDASTDATPALLADAARREARLRVITREQNAGLTAALGEALAFARGAYVARHDADDVSLPRRFEIEATYLDRNPNVGIVGSAYEIVDVEGAPLSVSRPATAPSRLRRQLRRRNPLAHGSLMMRADVLKQVGGYRAEFRMAQDYDLLRRVADRFDVASVPEVLYRLRLSPGGGSLSRRSTQDHFARQAGEPAKAVAAPAAAPDAELARQRYECLAALHLIKAGRTEEAQRRLAACTHPDIRAEARRLVLFSRVPPAARAVALRLKHLWETSF
jgi:glycosyltransferase involved in cell wall biosynthesis